MSNKPVDKMPDWLLEYEIYMQQVWDNRPSQNNLRRIIREETERALQRERWRREAADDDFWDMGVL